MITASVLASIYDTGKLTAKTLELRKAAEEVDAMYRDEYLRLADEFDAKVWRSFHTPPIADSRS
jgi:hypothetical protein